ncbi:MAG: fibronectin type III domain-containing protein [Burkholderiales bacterium]|nr:fibronectin type III domain-containing protein [Burkholderiales bacterium]
MQIEDARIDLAPRAVRIIEISEAGDDGSLQILAEDLRVTGSVVQLRQPSSGYTYSGGPPSQASTQAVMMPTAATNNVQQLWLGVSAGDNWGGSSVWISATGSDYRRVAEVNVRARMGTLTGSTPGTSSQINPAQTLAVGVTGSTTLGNVSQADADADRSLLWVSGELMSYRDATLTAPASYTLGYLRRGLYGTASPAHSVGDPWLRLDDTIVKIDIPAFDLGATLFVKVTSRNALGTYVQGLEEVAAFTVALTANPSPPDAVQGLALTAPFVSTYFEANWASAARASDYQVELRSAADAPIRTVYTSAPVFRYLYADALDDGDAKRSYTVKVRGSNTGGNGPWATLAISNPAPDAITGLLASGTGTSRTVTWDASGASDLAGYLARYSATPGFDPAAGEGTGFHDGPAATAALTGLTVATDYYVRVAAFDVWDRDIAELIWSAEYSFSA